MGDDEAQQALNGVITGMSAFDPIMSAITPKADIPHSAVDVRY